MECRVFLRAVSILEKYPYNGQADYWWLRSPYLSYVGYDYAYYVDPDGVVGGYYVYWDDPCGNPLREPISTAVRTM